MKLQRKQQTSTSPKRRSRTVAWMDGDLNADIWVLQRRDLSLIRFSFHEEVGNGFRLSDQSHEPLRHTMVEAIAAYASHQGFSKDFGESIYYLARGFLRLFRWLEVNGIPLTAVSSTVAMRYASHLVNTAGEQGRQAEMPEAESVDLNHRIEFAPNDDEENECGDKPNATAKRLAATSLQAALKPLIILWQFRDRLAMHLPEEPFPDGTGAVAKFFDLDDGHGEIIPLASGCHLLFGAIKLLNELGPLVISAASKETHAYPVGHFDLLNDEARRLGLNLHVVGRSSKPCDPHVHNIQTVKSEVMPHALLVVLGVLAVARQGEIKELKINSISGSAEGGHWITRRIGKNYREDRGAPVSPDVVKAVQIIESLLADRRAQLSTNALLPKRPFGNKQATRLITFTSDGLNRLARIAGVPMEKTETEQSFWHFTPKQFRTFGACLWVYQFELPVAALSAAMFHFDWTMTSYYLNDPTMRSWVDKFKRRFTLEFVEKAATGGEGFSGLQSKRLTRLVARLRVTMRLTTEDAVKRVVKAIAEDPNMVVRPNAWGYCFAARGVRQERRAQCMKAGLGRIGPDGFIVSTASSASVCCGCRFFGSSHSRVAYLRAELKRVDARTISPRLNEQAKILEMQRAVLLNKLIGELNARSESI